MKTTNVSNIKKAIVSILFLLGYLGVSGQDTGVYLYGTVIDSVQKKPLENVTVHIGSSHIQTDTDGQFSMYVGTRTSMELTFGIVGYIKQVRNWTRDEGNKIVIQLVPSNNVIDEVVVSTGYQSLPRERATGSFEVLGRDKMEQRIHQNVMEQLNGRVASVLFDSPIVDPSYTPKLNIRGRNTIFSNDQPLYVVDNMAYDGDITLINPNDVESITVLKDAAASSIWGARAGNGVIVITTRKGKQDEPMKMSFTSSFIWSPKPDLSRLTPISSTDFIDFELFMFGNGYYTPFENRAYPPALTPVVETLIDRREGRVDEEIGMARIDSWRKQDVRDQAKRYLFEESMRQQYNVNVSGGTRALKYFLSVNFDGNKERQIDNNNKRFSIRSNNTYQLGSMLEVGSNIVFSQRGVDNIHAPGVSNFSAFSLGSGKSLYPYAQFVDAEGNHLPMLKDLRYTFKNTAEQRGLLDWAFVPMDEIYNNDSRYTVRTTDYLFNPSLSFKPLPMLSFFASYQFQRESKESRITRDKNSYDVRNTVNRFAQVDAEGNVTFPIPHESILDKSDSELSSHQGRMQVNLQTSFAEKHHINGIAGFEIREIRNSGSSNLIYGYSERGMTYAALDLVSNYKYYDSALRGRIPSGLALTSTNTRFLSYFANTAYNYNNRYTISASARIDKSNMFGVKTNQRSVPLWSSGLLWHIGNEAFYKVGWLPRLSLRATFGYGGNVSDAVGITTLGLSFAHLTNARQATITNPPNESLRWEKNQTMNIGIDFGLKNNVVSGSIEFFSKRNTDLLSSADIDPTTGLGTLFGQSTFLGNIATTSGKGIDLTLNAVNMRKTRFSWETSAIFSIAQTRVEKYFSQSSTAASYINSHSMVTPLEDYPVFAVLSYPWAGLSDQGMALGMVDGQISSEYNEILNADPASLIYHGPAKAPFFGSLSNSFRYGDFTLTVNMNYRFGSYFKRNTIAYSGLLNRWAGHVDYALRWQKPGDELHTNVPALNYPINNNAEAFYLGSAALVERADYIKIQDLYFDYQFRSQRLARWGVKSLKARAYASNFGYLWLANSRNVDPFFDNIVRPATAYTLGISAEF